MSLYDILMLAVFVGSILFGLWKGLAWQAASLASIFVSYFVALNFRGALSAYISAQEPWNQFAAMLLLFLGTSLIIWLAYGYLKQTIERLRLRGFDTQAGGLLGAFKGAFLCMLITLFAVTLFGENVRNQVIASRSGGYIATAINELNSMVPDEIHTVLNERVQEFNNKLDEQSPGFIEESEQKFTKKLQTIRGQFSVPTADSLYTNAANPAKDPSGSVTIPPNSPTNNNSIPSPINLEKELQAVGDDVINAAKKAGNNFIQNSFNR